VPRQQIELHVNEREKRSLAPTRKARVKNCRETDISPLTGLTNAALAGHGGPNYGFFSAMKLCGFCPKVAAIEPATAMRYRFLYATLADPGTLIPITGANVYEVLVGSRLIQWKLIDDTLAWTFQSIWVQGSGATPDPTPTPGGPGPWGVGAETCNCPGCQWLDRS
jgi:hypothetical protein